MVRDGEQSSAGCEHAKGALGGEAVVLADVEGRAAGVAREARGIEDDEVEALVSRDGASEPFEGIGLDRKSVV